MPIIGTIDTRFKSLSFTNCNQNMRFILLFAGLSIHALAQQLGPHANKPILDRGYLTNTSLMAPLFHNVSAGPAWVVPKKYHDLSAQEMSCECFDPSREPTTTLDTGSMIVTLYRNVLYAIFYSDCSFLYPARC